MSKLFKMFLCLGLLFILCSCDEEKDNSNNNVVNNENKLKDNQKDLTCTLLLTGNNHKDSVSTLYGIFEDDILVYTKLNIEKKYIEDYDPYDDTWTTDNIDSCNKKELKGFTCKVEVKDRVTYVETTYDMKENPELMDLVTTHKEYNDFINNLEKQGYKCNN